MTLVLEWAGPGVYVWQKPFVKHAYLSPAAQHSYQPVGRRQGIYEAPSFRPNVIVLMIIQCARAT